MPFPCLGADMRRREFITLVGSAAVRPLAARAQQAEGMRRIAVLLGWSESDPEFRSWIATFAEELARLGWVDGRNVQMDVRWTRGDVRRMQTFAKELVELQPDVILASTTPVTAALQRETRTLPIVFVVVVRSGWLRLRGRSAAPRWKHHGVHERRARDGGQVAGDAKEIAPRVRVGGNDVQPRHGARRRSIFPEPVRSCCPIAVGGADHDACPQRRRNRSGDNIAWARASGLVLQSDSFLAVHQGTVISLAARNNAPAIGADIPSFRQGGRLALIWSEFPGYFSPRSILRRSRLRGANPSDLPVQTPTKYELGINEDGPGTRPTIPGVIPAARRRGDRIRRREFIASLGAVAAWPFVARAERAESRVRRLGCWWAYPSAMRTRRAATRPLLAHFKNLVGRSVATSTSTITTRSGTARILTRRPRQ